MTEKIQAIRGMNDVLPQETVYWQKIETVCRDVVVQYGYREIRFPILEQTHLFKRSIGDVTDIVEKEMYTFKDRNEDELSLRPEGTAGCVRAGIEHGLLYNQIQRLWYMGPMFRHERPQKGRLRQFHQLGVEAFGMLHPAIDVEIILLSKRILDQLGLSDKITLQINNLGDLEQRKRYQEKLVQYFTAHKDQLDEDSIRRLAKNPMRILDSKNPEIKLLIDNAPRLIDFLKSDGNQLNKDHFDQACTALEKMNIKFEINPHLVRGLDYYCLTVFEWVTNQLGAQGTVCAGGRYDKLVELLGGKATPAIGFAMGIERLVLLLQEKEKWHNAPDFYVISSLDVKSIEMVEKIRTQFPAIKIEMDLVETGTPMKRADRSGASCALLINEDHSITLKYLREKKESKIFSLSEFISFLTHTRFQC
ncbi:MAG: histidine--tRNA ligase [Gammaproteobacteria bacterium RIFCSPHIGHO2_02_FULL_39_13]|nr:MAG: histidine--tRNA ligase [Gammaproteobacteria bacterium RIFCSPHIGHO2_02_FULL_39_13]OGT49234.1 MAG: histidine--tRNA ligase [Gammaproteobacteria bacterium RIFCSPHIGHO2_12_FULL_39_24]